ncbi:MAG: FtsX-like permease family protein, partial [bacterium]|nr:FtsX-like permease family protein [bacterium]
MSIGSPPGGAHLNSALLGIFAAAALFLAITGLYTVLSYAVHQRHHEIGVRLSIGASKAEIFKQFMKEGMFLLLIGLVAGVVTALVLSRAIASVLYGISQYDPAVYLGVLLLVILTAVLAN